jgi:hypothetical protein
VVVGSLKEINHKEFIVDFIILRVIHEKKVERRMKRMWGVGLKRLKKNCHNDIPQYACPVPHWPLQHTAFLPKVATTYNMLNFIHWFPGIWGGWDGGIYWVVE